VLVAHPLPAEVDRLPAMRLRQRAPTDAIARAKNSRIVTVTPWTEQRADGSYLCIPTEAGYDVSEEKMPARAVQ